MIKHFIFQHDSSCELLVRCSSMVALTVVATLVFSAQAQEPSVEEDLHIHRATTETTSPYDAFAYANRISAAPSEGETPVAYAGAVIFSRLSNIEGRIQVKIMDGFDRAAYLGYKTFMRAWPEPGDGVGNCVSCHTPAAFTDKAKHIVDDSGSAKATISLRNQKKSDEELEAIVRQKIKMAAIARKGNSDIDEAYRLIELRDEDVANLVSFLQSLNEAPKETFRQLIVDSEILDTSDLIR